MITSCSSGQSILILWSILQVPANEIANQRYECYIAFPAYQWVDKIGDRNSLLQKRRPEIGIPFHPSHIPHFHPSFPFSSFTLPLFYSSYPSKLCTRITSFPRGSITFTAAHPCCPTGNGNDSVLLNISKLSVSITPLRSRAILSHAFLSGKNACVIQKVRPS